MSHDELRLFTDAQFMSPYAMSVFVVLREKGLSFDVEQVDLEANEQLQSTYQARSLTARVPTLQHHGFALSESSAITEYLEDSYPPPAFAAVYPQDIKLRARARQLQAWLRSDLVPIRAERPTTAIFRQAAVAPLSETAQVATRKLFQASEALLEQHGTSLFERWSIADADLALMLNRLVASGDDVPEKLVAYVQHQWERPSIQAWVELGVVKSQHESR